MKFLKYKNGFTLIELIISLMISSILFFIIFSFLSNNVEELSDGNYKIDVYDQLFKYRDKLNRFILGGYIDMSVISIYENDILYLKNAYDTEGVIFGVVNKDSMKLQENYVYGNNILGYRLLSEIEINDINSDNSIVYDYNFFNDKIYNGLKTKDFKVDFYNSGTILDINVGILPYYNNSHNGLSFSGNTYLSKDLFKFNLNF